MLTAMLCRATCNLLTATFHLNRQEEARQRQRVEELLAEVNALGIGPAALGGAPTALAVHLETAPCHIAALPVAVNMGCCAMRSASVKLV